uniref:Predicted ATP-binding protein involved in virulence n=1 Tax=Candidatus Kentrum eta TaxID=2126337 RepID=A0A450VEC1_9GAMM|nr:MAG: Predicted ATP-binding protein involved in virulence [Candidatus Kentron sp. H]VFK03143.1 MAG: Predicted ATP-binding protein involved in virulence [Candidatus Kentron sp. H]VFK05850.1 MAG: Predicted ATP-binding protein involved in virulence [Candidatus Kentron sp. H]
MMLEKIRITGLFDRFDYEIELKAEGITILTGPNGYGKTTILRIIDAFASGFLPFFFHLPFSGIVFVHEGTESGIRKKENDTLEIQYGDKEPLTLNKKGVRVKIEQSLQGLGYRPAGENRWFDTKTETFHTTESLIDRLGADNIREEWMPDFAHVYLIREQRLIGKRPVAGKGLAGLMSFEEGAAPVNLGNTIEEDANALSVHIKGVLAEASKTGQKLDSSFPERLFDETGSIDKEAFDERYDAIRQKQNALSRYGLSTTRAGRHASFKPENAKALLVYLNDTERKLAVFDGILQRLDAFSALLDKKQFDAKRIEVSPDFGFRFRMEDGKELPLTALSSGEQQAVVLLYELLFQVGPDTLVLMDEPEISLHVAWQKEFLDDLSKIVALQGIRVIVATHSPRIIGAYWDWVVDLRDLSRHE